MDTSAHILIVDDDDRLRSLLERFLGQHFTVSVAANGQEAQELAAGYQFDAAVVDVMMPDISGINLTPKLPCPVLLLTALGEAENRITGLKAGAEDYLVKPFEAEELLLRLQNILKHTKPEASDNSVNLGAYTYTNNGQLLKDDHTILLSETEQVLVKTFVDNINQNVSRLLLAEKLGIEERSVDVQVTRLRKKLPEAQIQSVRGVGYKLLGG